MQHYVTYYQKPKISKELQSITDPELFLLSGGKRGMKNLNILLSTDRVTRCNPHLSQNDLMSSTYLQKITQYESQMLQLTSDIDKFLADNIIEECYSRFSIPKSTGGLRWIDAPNEELMEIQRRVAKLLDYMGLIPHNSAHAYTKNRSITTNANFHRDSNHFLKIDLSGFFPSITKDVLKTILPQLGILAYTQLERNGNIHRLFNNFLKAIIEIATLRGILPQGTPLSPLLSNLIMIPFDYKMIELLKTQPKQILITRYADDLCFSSYYAFADRKEEAKKRIEDLVNVTLASVFGSGVMTINYKKTTVSTKYGKNRITGIKVNGENKVSIGYKEKQNLKKNLAKLIIMKKDGNLDFTMAQEIIGYYNFLHAVEPDYAKYMRQTLERKFNIPTNLTKWLYN